MWGYMETEDNLSGENIALEFDIQLNEGEEGYKEPKDLCFVEVSDYPNKPCMELT